MRFSDETLYSASFVTVLWNMCLDPSVRHIRQIFAKFSFIMWHSPASWTAPSLIETSLTTAKTLLSWKTASTVNCAQKHNTTQARNRQQPDCCVDAMECNVTRMKNEHKRALKKNREQRWIEARSAFKASYGFLPAVMVFFFRHFTRRLPLLFSRRRAGVRSLTLFLCLARGALCPFLCLRGNKRKIKRKKVSLLRLENSALFSLPLADGSWRNFSSTFRRQNHQNPLSSPGKTTFQRFSSQNFNHNDLFQLFQPRTLWSRKKSAFAQNHLQERNKLGRCQKDDTKLNEKWETWMCWWERMLRRTNGISLRHWKYTGRGKESTGGCGWGIFCAVSWCDVKSPVSSKAGD